MKNTRERIKQILPNLVLLQAKRSASASLCAAIIGNYEPNSMERRGALPPSQTLQDVWAGTEHWSWQIVDAAKPEARLPVGPTADVNTTNAELRGTSEIWNAEERRVPIGLLDAATGGKKGGDG